MSAGLTLLNLINEHFNQTSICLSLKQLGYILKSPIKYLHWLAISINNALEGLFDLRDGGEVLLLLLKMKQVIC